MVLKHKSIEFKRIGQEIVQHDKLEEKLEIGRMKHKEISRREM